MASVIGLASGALRCEIVPALGGCIAGLWLGELAVLRSRPPGQLASARQAGSYPLVPFSNRVAHARLQWQGTSHPLVRLGTDEPHAIHGIGWQRPWEVLEQDGAFAMLAFEHRPDASWPFAFDASQTFRLSPEGLEMTLGITNQSDQAQPVGLGWHPWFPKRSRSRIAFEATGRWETGDDKLPTVRKPSRGLDADCARLAVDHCFDGWSGTVHLRDEALHVRISSSLRRLVVCTDDTRDAIAIEPVSHVNNAIALAGASAQRALELGLEVLAPGASLSAQMGITINAVA